MYGTSRLAWLPERAMCCVLLVTGDGMHRLAGQVIQARGNSGFDDIYQHLIAVVYVLSV